MKKLSKSKKVFSAIAALAISATAIGGVLTVINLNKNNTTIDGVSNDKNIVLVDTALGQVRSTSGKKYFAGPNAIPTAAENDGTMAHPFNIKDILGGEGDVKLQPGDTVYVLPGTYSVSTPISMRDSSGTYNSYIRVINAALDREGSGYTGTETQAVIDFSAMTFASTNRGVSIDASYIYWYGVDICGAGDNGMYIGGSYNTVEYSEFYNNRDTGLQLGRTFSDQNSIYQWPSYNLIKNCTSHNNYDNETFGENADGFAAKLTVGFGNVFDGCIAYRNSDDGWDLYAKTDSGNIGTVIIYNCVAFENGYLEYTREECNSLFPTYDKSMAYHTNENNANPYKTRDGDGNGFKLGGSIMEGDVVLYNCLAFNNRMHGVTDNSNPGYIKQTYVTSYNNSAAIDMNGNVASVKNDDTHSNIDVSRQTYSYNSVNNVLSVRDASAISLDKDNYRGTITNSLLDANGKTNVIQGSAECDTKNSKLTYTSQEDGLVAATMFKKLPNSGEDNVFKGNGNSMNISGGAITSMIDSRFHLTLRNSDHSVNMGDVLAKTAEGETLITGYLGAGVTAGSTLNLDGWDKYTHFYQNDLVNGDADTEDRVWVERAKEALTINTVEEAVYQDFEVPVKMLNVEIKWESSDETYVVVKDKKEEVEVSSSGSEYVWIEVWRAKDEDKHITLTATITKGDAEATKVFNLTLKKGNPSIGTIYVEDEYGVTVGNEEKHIVDRFTPYLEPEIKVQNGLYPDSHKLLKDTEYDVTTTYEYQVDGNAKVVEVKQFSPSVAGVFTITHTVSLKGDSKTSTMSYKIYVASADANVEFEGDSVVKANRDGFSIAGAPSSATGIIYALTSTTELTDLHAADLKTKVGVQSYEFRDTSFEFNFIKANTETYFVYYALANANGAVTSRLYSAKITKVDISTVEDFVKIARGSKIGTEEPSQTIYALTKDLDFTGVTFTGMGTFTGLFNGLGHTLSNLSDSQFIFYKIDGATIMNVKIDGLTINTTAEKSGFVSECYGGDFYNIAFTNVSISSTQQRVGGLIGLVGNKKGSADLTISQVSIVNDADHKIVGSTRVGGLIGYVQNYGFAIGIDNCYIITDIEATGKGEGGGMVGTWEDQKADKLIISQCYYSGIVKTPAAPGSSRLGGMLGYHKGGAGVLTITRCISLAKLHIEGVLRDTSVKNASPIIGNFSTSQSAVISVSYCIGLMEEYNTDYDVQVFTEENLKRHSSYLTGADYLNLDNEIRWTVVVDEDPADSRDLYKAPYVVLNFLGDWD